MLFGSLILDLLAPAQSKRSFSMLELLSKMCIDGTPARAVLESFGHHPPRLKACQSNTWKRQEMSWNSGPKTGSRKVIFGLCLVFGCEGAPGRPPMPFLVPSGGRKDDSQGGPKCPSGPKGDPQGLQDE